MMTATAKTEPSLEFTSFAKRAAAGDSLSVVFLGGSLTWGAQATNPQFTSYRALIQRKLTETYPKSHFAFWDAAIGGTGSQLAAFRLERDVLAQKPDLVFLDFTINDDPYSPPNADRLASYESLVRRLITAGVPVIQVILPAKGDVSSTPAARPLDAKHKAIAAAYGLPIADAVSLAKARVAAGEITANELWDLPEDSTHPGDAGYALYADAAWGTYEQAVSEGASCRLPEEMVNAPTYLSVNRHRLTTTALPSGWIAGKPHRNAVAYDFVCSRWMDDLAIAKTSAAPLRLKVKAANVMLFGEKTKQSGSFAVRIDDSESKTYSAKCDEGNMWLVHLVASGLDPEREHEVEITPVLGPGEELRIESICVAGGPATVSIDPNSPPASGL